MKLGLKIALYLFLVLGVSLSGWKFKQNYDLAAAKQEEKRSLAITEAAAPEYGEQAQVKQPSTNHHLGLLGAGMVLSLIGLAVLLGQDISHYFANRAGRVMFDQDDQGLLGPDYEEAEEAWNRGEYLEAIRQLRDYLEKRPNELHVCLRIAEIYEKDLHNHLAAALEYEEVLTKNLPRERWGWAAIHLCNIYNGKMDQPDKAIALLQRLDLEFGDTKAAQKARARLQQLADQGVVEPPSQPPRAEGEEEPAPEESEMETADAQLPSPEPSGFQLPRGFAPKR